VNFLWVQFVFDVSILVTVCIRVALWRTFNWVEQIARNGTILFGNVTRGTLDDECT